MGLGCPFLVESSARRLRRCAATVMFIKLVDLGFSFVDLFELLLHETYSKEKKRPFDKKTYNFTIRFVEVSFYVLRSHGG